MSERYPLTPLLGTKNARIDYNEILNTGCALFGTKSQLSSSLAKSLKPFKTCGHFQCSKNDDISCVRRIIFEVQSRQTKAGKILHKLEICRHL